MSTIGEVVHVDEQEVAYEVEIENDGVIIEEINCHDEHVEVEEEVYVDNANEIVEITPSGEEIQCFELTAFGEDRWVDHEGTEYIYDELTQTYRPCETVETVAEYVDVEDKTVMKNSECHYSDEEVASTSQIPPRTYWIRRGGERKGMHGRNCDKAEFAQYTLVTTETSMRKRRRTIQITPGDTASALADGNTIKKLTTEIASLQKVNDDLRKKYEESNKKLNDLIVVHKDAKQRFSTVESERKSLISLLTKLKKERHELANRINFEDYYHYNK